jgi:hypothetical protein
MHSGETVFQSMNFALVPDWQYAVQYSLAMLGSSSKLHLIVSHAMTWSPHKTDFV